MATKFEGWKNLPTIQSKEILSELMEAKENAMAKMLLCSTGMGKTNTVSIFVKSKSKNTFLVTVGVTYKLRDVIQELMEQMGLQINYGKNELHRNMRRMAQHLVELSAEGGEPIIILDEMENGKLPLMKAIKQLYDAVKDACGIVLIGTEQLVIAMQRKEYGQSIPQFRRRFRAGTRNITPLNKAKHFKPFFDLYIPDAKEVQDMLFELADNYGELHDYLEPVLRHCSKKGIDITLEEFCRYHKLIIPQKFTNTKTKAA